MLSPGIPSPADNEAPRRPVGRPPLGSEDKHERILTEALKLFAIHGYSGTSLRDIASASDISKAGLLHHFGSKAHLFAEVLEHRDLGTYRVWNNPSQDPWEFLEQFASLVQSNQDEPILVHLYTSVAAMGVTADNPAHDWLKHHFEFGINHLITSLEHGKAIGKIRESAPSEAIARLLMSASDGLQIQWLCQESDAEPSATGIDMADHIRMLISMIRERWGVEAD